MSIVKKQPVYYALCLSCLGHGVVPSTQLCGEETVCSTCWGFGVHHPTLRFYTYKRALHSSGENTYPHLK